jgi:predicted RNA binding protein YcfA (HicA-like mRNA interferase family)
MGAIPVLKPREVAACIERLGFVAVRQHCLDDTENIWRR